MPAPKSPQTAPLPAPTQSKLVINPDIQLQCLRYSPSGDILAAGGCDGTVRRWDMTRENPVELPKIDGHNGWVASIGFHGASGRLFSADSWGRLIAWVDPNHKPNIQWNLPTAHDGWIRKLEISPDGRFILTCGSDGWVRLWDSNTGKITTEVKFADPVLTASIHPSGTTIVVGTLRGEVSRWEVATRKRVGAFEATAFYMESRLQDVGGARCLAFSPDGKLLYVGGTAPVNGGSLQGQPLILAFDWDSSRLAATYKGSSPSDGLVYDLAVRSSGELLAVSSGQPGRGQFIVCPPTLDSPSFTTTKMPNCHSLALHPDGERVAIAATNAGSNGNGKGKGEYKANFSPVYFWTLPSL